jgi:hypothetical protein
MIKFIEKYYVFTLCYIALVAALFIFKENKDIANIIIGALVGMLTAPITLKEGL